MLPDPLLGARATTRRTALVAGGLACGAVLGGCGPSGPADVGGPDAADPDEEVLEAARRELATALAQVTEARRRHRALRRRLAPLQRTHTAQLEVLAPDGVAVATTPLDLAGGPEAALERVRRDEARLQRRLVTWAVAVDSGPLARLLAATSAGVAQQLALLEETGGSA